MTTPEVPILYLDHHLLAVNKPAGLVIHPTYKHLDNTMWNILLASLDSLEQDAWQPPELPDEPGWERAPADVRELLRERRQAQLWKEEGLLPRPALLHRLDKDTSGVVLLARTARARKHIIRQFHDHTIVKRYLAVTQPGAPEWARPRTSLHVEHINAGQTAQPLAAPYSLPALGAGELLINGPIIRSPEDRRRCIVGPEGQEAQTRVRVLARGGSWTLVEAEPITGRIHQIRTHLAALGYAIVGDQTYALPALEGTPQATLQRQYLHAHSVTLRRYPDNESCTITAPLALDLVAWLEAFFPEGLEAYHAVEQSRRSGQPEQARGPE